MRGTDRDEEMGKRKMGAGILGIGTANPPDCISQEDYPHFCFRLTRSSSPFTHLLSSLCEKTGIKQRYLHLTEDILRANPSLVAQGAPSLELRQRISEAEIPRLGREAALRAIEDWGHPKSEITHLIFCAMQAVHMPGADFRLTLSLGLSPSIRRIMLYHQGCHVSVSALRLAKDMAENNRRARVLVVCCDMTIGSFCPPCEDDGEDLAMQTMYGDGAAAVIVGADVDESCEWPFFRIVTGAQTIIPDSDGAISGYRITATAIGRHINDFLAKMLHDMGIDTIKDWNSVFWVMQATGKPVLDRIEAELQLIRPQ